MSVLNPNSDEEPQECPLCMEFLELDDINFYPCSCGYQICRFCWNKIRTEGSGLCPACRSPYQENPADFKPLTAEELAKIKEEKRKKDQAKKQKISENRKHLANVRVVQRNLVFVVGLSPRLADQDVLKKSEYFGKFGRIHKIVINHSTSYAGNQSQGPSASAYVTYYRPEDALRAIEAVNNIHIDGRTLKASLGTTKYCSQFMKNLTCPKPDCMYLHELGDEAASFTKEEMQQGKHTEYEKSLHEELMASMSAEHTDEILTNGTSPGSSSGKDGGLLGKTSRTPSPKVGNSGWPILSSAGSGQMNSTGSVPSSLGVVGGTGRSNNNYRSDTAENKRQQPSPVQAPIHRRDSGTILHHLHHSPSQQPPDSPSSGRSANRTPHDFHDEHLPQLQPPQLERDLHHESNEVRSCESNHEWTSISKEDLFGEDDLGFDPFHETQKALAEMIESESKQHLEALQLLGGGGNSGSLSNGGIPLANSNAGNRPKQPPPGFNLLNLTGVQHPSVPSLLSHELSNIGGALDNYAGGNHHLPPVNQGFVSHNDFTNGFRHSSLPFGASSPSENPLGHRGHHQSNHLTQDKASKEWQEGLRALLPNVNVSFGAPPNQPDVVPPHNNGRLFSSPTSAINERLHHERRQQHSSWNTISDWTMIDPAIVGGQIADPSSNRSESPPDWIKDNLHQLTADPYSPVTNMLPGFSGLNLGNQQHSGGLSNWGGQGGLLANTPPPGFSFGRGQNVGSNALQHPFPNLSALANNSDGHPLENEFRGLIRS